MSIITYVTFYSVVLHRKTENASEVSSVSLNNTTQCLPPTCDFAGKWITLLIRNTRDAGCNERNDVEIV